jgi:hypothetical protein
MHHQFTIYVIPCVVLHCMTLHCPALCRSIVDHAFRLSLWAAQTALAPQAAGTQQQQQEPSHPATALAQLQHQRGWWVLLLQGLLPCSGCDASTGVFLRVSDMSM